MTAGAAVLSAYLDRLREALPARQREAVVSEVSSLVSDRLEADGGSPDDPAALRRALAALGPPETLASALAGGGFTIDVATRRAFGRLLAVVFAGHLVLASVLAAVGSQAPLLPGLVGPLPHDSVAAVACGVIGLFALDAGLLGVFFLVLGRERTPALLPRLRLAMPGTRRDAVTSLVLLALVAVLANVTTFRDGLVSVAGASGREPVLGQEALGLVPFLDVVLGLFAIRHVLLFVARGESTKGVLLDALASLAAAGLAVAVLTRDTLVRIPSDGGLSTAQAAIFQDVLYRVIVVIAFVSALLLATRFVKRCLRFRELIAR